MSLYRTGTTLIWKKDVLCCLLTLLLLLIATSAINSSVYTFGKQLLELFARKKLKFMTNQKSVLRKSIFHLFLLCQPSQIIFCPFYLTFWVNVLYGFTLLIHSIDIYLFSAYCYLPLTTVAARNTPMSWAFSK